MTAPLWAIEQKRTSKEVEMGTVDRISRRWARWVVFAGVNVGLVLSIADGLTARAACQTVRGKFTIQIVTGPECQSPAGLCGIGTYIGGLSGASTFAASSVVPSADTPTTGVVAVTGDFSLDTRRGTLFTKDAIMLRTIGGGEFAEVDTVVAGTGDFAGASGVIRGTGTSTATTVDGDYAGEICTP
jgi:hypothetical protein